MSHRFFRTADDALYENVRLSLDAAWGLVNQGCTCISPAANSPRDKSGRIVLAVDEEFCTYAAVAAVLPSLLASEAVEEISEDEYHASMSDPFLV